MIATPRARAVIALLVVDVRRTASRVLIGLIPGIIFLAPSAISNHSIVRATYMDSATFPALGALLVPMVLVGDRRQGILDFLRRLPLSRAELASARLLMSVGAATLGALLFVGTLTLAFHIDGKTFPTTAAIASVSGVAILTFAVSGVLAPLFARLPMPIAVAIPAGLATALLPTFRRGDALVWLTRATGLLVRGDLPPATLTLIIVSVWLAAAVFALLYVWVLGMMLQPRPEPTPAAAALLDTLPVTLPGERMT
jgi:hypothetical protein